MKQTLKDVLIIVCLVVGLILIVVLTKQGYEMSLMFQVIGGVCGAAVILIWTIKDNDRPYYDFLKLWFEFHVKKMHRDPQPKAYYENMLRSHDKLYLLEKTNPTGFERKKMLWKKQLIEAILNASGLFSYKATGEKKNKIRYKFYKDGVKYKVKGKSRLT